jgi:8-amino-7-oxononanoate synthase
MNFYSSALQNLKEKNLYRQLVESDVVGAVTVRRGKKKFISFSSNDYLGLSQNSEVKKSAIAAIEKFGLGAGASRYITGNNSLYTKLEKEIACMKNCDEAIVFSSGYAAAIGVIPALVGEGDLIIADRLIHSSLIDGAKLSGARLLRFLHNDVAHCKKILEENRLKFKKCLIITETVFSMDGDVGRISELLELAKNFDCLFLSDAAHDLWIRPSPQPSPTLATLGGEGVVLQLGTLSKSVGTLGGYVAGDKILIEYLRNFAKSAIYSTALPPAVLAASIASLKIISKKNLGKKSLKNAEYFCDLMNLPKPESAIVVIIIGENKKTLEIAKKIADQGFLISAIRPPTVESGKARLRITFSSKHKKAQIKKLAEILNFLTLFEKEGGIAAKR